MNFPAKKKGVTPSALHLATHCASSLPLAAPESRVASLPPLQEYHSWIVIELTMSEGRHVWSHPETLALIDAWEERYEVLRSQRRTAHVHEDIRQALGALRIEKSIRQIVVKIDNLTQKYRKTKLSGKANPTWVYFRRLDKFMGHQTRYNRRRCVRIKKQEEEEEEEESSNEAMDQSSNSLVISSISSVQGSSSGDLDLLQLAQNGVANYREDLVNTIANQLDVQRQSLEVQKQALIVQDKAIVHQLEVQRQSLEVQGQSLDIQGQSLEVQRQSLKVLEKAINLMRTIVANSGELQVPKTETEQS